MSTEANKIIIRRYIEEVVNTGKCDDLARFISPDYIETLDKTGLGRGVEGARAHILGVRQTFPDLHLTVEQQIAESEWVVTRITARGTHCGTWLGMMPINPAQVPQIAN
jgi:predicted ester cyclase